MKKNYFIGLLLIAVALIAVSCSADKAVQDELVSVSFEKLQARALGFDATATADTSNTLTAAVQTGEVSSYYWSYKATKTDAGNGFKTGQTDGFVAWKSGNATGLDGTLEVSKGTWTFELRAYASADDITANSGNNYIFSGKVESQSITQDTTVAVSMTHNSSLTGNAKADVSVKAKITDTTGSSYDITKIEIVIDEDSAKTIELSKGESSDESSFYTWSGTANDIAKGAKKVTMKVYVDGAELEAAKKEISSANFFSGLTTKIDGTVTISLTENKANVTFYDSNNTSNSTSLTAPSN